LTATGTARPTWHQRSCWRSAWSSTSIVRVRQPVLLGERDEQIGREQPAAGVLLSHERLDAVELAVGEGDLRLVVDHELTVPIAPDPI
jgi:anti-sigma-K factor RskA